ncbi:MAG TPA: hypothetical protein VGW74_07050 [Propionibacteriaceae bacterium]|nr:hypothetical protein [Propionibacteriaceae bacterium]
MDLDAALGEMKRLSELIDAGVDAMRAAARGYAQAEHDYRLAKAQGWLMAPKGTVPEREAWVNAHTAEARRQRDVAEGVKQAALEAIRSRRTQLSAWQSWLAASREEMGMGRYGPEVAP